MKNRIWIWFSRTLANISSEIINKLKIDFEYEHQVFQDDFSLTDQTRIASHPSTWLALYLSQAIKHMIQDKLAFKIHNKHKSRTRNLFENHVYGSKLGYFTCKTVLFDFRASMRIWPEFNLINSIPVYSFILSCGHVVFFQDLFQMLPGCLFNHKDNLPVLFI